MTADPARADLSNWRTPPYNCWAFRNVDKVLPVARVSRGEGAARALDAAAANLSGFALRTGEETLGLEEALDATATDALVVLKDGRLVFERYAEGMGAYARHILMSATKSVIGLLAGRLAAAGEVDLSAPVERYLPEVAEGSFAGATLQQLLDMRSGVAFAPREVLDYVTAAGWDPPVQGRQAPAGLHAFFAGLRGAPAGHGGPFRYVSANTDLLGWALERAAGAALPELLSREVWSRIGAEHDAQITVDGYGGARATGGLCTTARDFARLGQALIDGDLTPPDWIETVEAGGDREAWDTGEFAPSFGRQMSYRDGWYVVHGPAPMVFAMGIHGQNLFVDRASRLVVCKLSSQDQPLDPRGIGLAHRTFAELRRLLR